MKIDRKIAITNFFGEGKHLYEDMLGYSKRFREEFQSNVARDIFVYTLDELSYEFGFYYLVNQTFYFIATMQDPLEVLTIPRDPNRSPYIIEQCEDTSAYELGTIVATFKSAAEMWDNFKIDGKSMEEIMPKSYITHIY